MNSLSQLRLDLLSEIAQVETSPQLASMKARALGKEGVLSERMRSLSTLPMSERTEAGRGLNLLKRELETALREKEAQLRKAQLNERLSQEAVDVTLPGRGLRPGGLHVITVVSERISAILRSMGFDMADGPEIEEDFFNFTALNTPSNHPARSMHDTFYVDVPGREGLLLRTHTSPVQVRYARRHSPPIRVFTIGKTFRVDSDATHSPMFHQVEGLWVGDDVNFCNLKCLYSDFLRAFFERNDLEIRFRPSYFPFTEPSAEIDIRFPDGPLAGCWLEISGAGQVHPNVVRNFNLDPQEHIGFAFGSGVERLAMLLHGIDDVRLFYNNDLRFLRQFVS